MATAPGTPGLRFTRSTSASTPAGQGPPPPGGAVRKVESFTSGTRRHGMPTGSLSSQELLTAVVKHQLDDAQYPPQQPSQSSSAAQQTTVPESSNRTKKRKPAVRPVGTSGSGAKTVRCDGEAVSLHNLMFTLRLLPRLHYSGYHAVFMCTDDSTAKRYAVKVIDPETLKLWASEGLELAPLAAACNKCPCVVPIHALCWRPVALSPEAPAVALNGPGKAPVEEALYVVQGFAEHRSLYDVLQRRRSPMGEGVVARVAAAVLQGLAALQAHDGAARDRPPPYSLSPSNVLLHASGAVQLALVGMLRKCQRKGKAYAQRLPMARGACGIYDSPEALSGGPVTHADVLHAAGVILLECLLGEHPFAREVCRRMAELEVRFPAGVSDGCRGFMRACLRQKREAPATAAELLRHPFLAAARATSEDVAAYLAGLGVAEGAAGRPGSDALGSSGEAWSPRAPGRSGSGGLPREGSSLCPGVPIVNPHVGGVNMEGALLSSCPSEGGVQAVDWAPAITQIRLSPPESPAVTPPSGPGVSPVASPTASAARRCPSSGSQRASHRVEPICRPWST